ncbi:MAG: hypothetical protein GWN18_15315 [Thermoplasmata archaeon]|nr:hypothetical protein [Thermoplasmata archaeon]NIS13435.1 hypothetical protein [Thermoplasmata archaeon]NIV80076.1 hypothetical protein [Thermoplasmata archaeon]NIW83890.1 hypothetical protein [Thermoplasmata archaeon]NIW90154.1 hypothetical protein [Thermoplasmata archaeon]
MEDEELQVGLPEDEAYRPPVWVRPVLALSMLAFAGMFALQLGLGLALVAGNETSVKAWQFWGNTTVLGGMFLVSAILIGLGIVQILRRRDDSLALFLLSIVVLSTAMLLGIIRFDGSGGPTTLLVLMLIPLLAMFGVQSREVRRWCFHSSGSDG